MQDCHTSENLQSETKNKEWLEYIYIYITSFIISNLSSFHSFSTNISLCHSYNVTKRYNIELFFFILSAVFFFFLDGQKAPFNYSRVYSLERHTNCTKIYRSLFLLPPCETEWWTSSFWPIDIKKTWLFRYN